MTNQQNDAITILLGLKGYNIEEIWEERDRYQWLYRRVSYKD